MKKNLNVVINNMQGEPLKNEDGTDITARQVVRDQLLMIVQDMKPDDKLNRYLVSKKVEEADGEPDLTSKEIVLILDTLGDTASPLAYGRIHDLLEGETSG